MEYLPRYLDQGFTFNFFSLSSPLDIGLMEDHAHNIIPFFPYRLFFLYIEPISAILGALIDGRPAEYLSLLTLSPTPALITAPSTQVNMSLYQLSNLYLLFALNEHLVLSSTTSLRVWKRLLFCLLIADFGHLVTMAPLGFDAYWKVWEWNAMLWGSVGFVYAGASMRLAFLFDLGMGEGPKHAAAARYSTTMKAE